MTRVRIAHPVVDAARGGARGTSLGGGGGAVYLAMPDDVVALTGPETPEMPNGIALPGPVPELPSGTSVTLAPGGLTWSGGSIALDDAEVYDPTVPTIEPGPWLHERAAYINALPAEPELALEGTEILRRAIESLDVDLALEAARVLTGRGGGLTPEGDDLLAAAAGTAHALAWPAPWIRALMHLSSPSGATKQAPGTTEVQNAPPEPEARTTRLSASLLRHAAEGRLIAPMLALLDPNGVEWRVAVDRLAVLGHSTGRAYLRAAALVMAASPGPD